MNICIRTITLKKLIKANAMFLTIHHYVNEATLRSIYIILSFNNTFHIFAGTRAKLSGIIIELLYDKKRLWKLFLHFLRF